MRKVATAVFVLILSGLGTMAATEDLASGSGIKTAPDEDRFKVSRTSETGVLWRRFRDQNRNSGSDTLSIGREVKTEIAG